MIPLIFSSKSYHWFERLLVTILGIMVAISIVLTLVQAGVALWQTVAADHHLIGLAVLFIGIAATYWGVRREEECSLLGRSDGGSV